MMGAGTTSWNTMPIVRWRLVISEVARVIMEEIPTASNCWIESSWLFFRSSDRISRPKRALKSLVTQLPHADIPV